MKKVLAVALNLQSSNRWRWPTASAQPSSSARGEERRWNFTCAFAAGTCSRLASSSSARVASGHQWRRKISKTTGGGNPTSCTPRWRVVPVPRGSPLNPPSLSKAGSATRGALPAAVQQVRAVQSRRTSLLMAGDGRTEGRTDGRTAGLGGCGAL